MRLLALVPALPGTSPGQRFRFEQWIPYLNNAGWEVTLVPFSDPQLQSVLYQPRKYYSKSVGMLRALQRRLDVVRNANAFDAVYLNREAALIGPAVFERMITRLGVPLIFDFDDPIWIHYVSPTNGLLSLLKCTGKTRSICRIATHVTVGNRLQAAWAQRYTDRVTVLASTIELAEYPARDEGQRGDRIRLGWTGSHSTVPFLETIREPLRALARERDFDLNVISNTTGFDFGDGIATIAQPWRADNEAESLHAFDIGLAPFPNSGWTPWRNHCKVLQYMAVGLPVVASPVGIVPDYIQDGENGFLADTPSEWVDKLTLLMDDPELRSRLGRAARKSIVDGYSAAHWAPRFEAVLRNVASH